jgi:iron complex outermembrane receptor protein
VSDNRHRTHAALASVRATTTVGGGASLTAGAEAGGDWIRSSNLGDHDIARVSAFGEWRQAIDPRTQIDASLRVDRYSEFGVSANPSAGIGWRATPALRLRGSVARAFRVPTFTERFYSDPANLARADVGPERAWAAEAGADLHAGRGWWIETTVFGRMDDDVIDWLRPTVADRWQTYNIREVSTLGVELGVRRLFAGGTFVHAQYAGLDLDAPAVGQLSKYVLDYAPHSVTVAGTLRLPGRLQFGPRLEYRRRTRPAGTSDDVLLDLRVGRRFGPSLELSVEGTNLLDAEYQEIAGVRMPGAAMAVSLAWIP